jgi:hypothetical protein
VTEFVHLHQNARLQALERRVATIMEHLGIQDDESSPPAGVSARVAELARSGRKMQAIKAHMEDSSVGFGAATEAVAAIT